MPPSPPDVRRDPAWPRADVVGSLLRPAWLLEAREQHAAGDLPAAAFKEIEDRAVGEALALQEGVGLPVLTDGEQRRTSFQAQLVEAVEGFGDPDLQAFLWGTWHDDQGEHEVERPELTLDPPLRRRRHLCAEEFTWTRGRTDRLVKVTLPSPSLFANFYPATDPPDAWPTLDDFLGEVARLLHEEVQELARLGARYLQLDAPHYTALLDEEARAFYEARGWTLEDWQRRGPALDNAVFEGFEGLTALHLCRGNQDSRWLVEGAYDPLIPVLQRLEVDRLLLEYDDPRSGSFEPLADLDDDQVIVLGLITTKTPGVADLDHLVARVDEAARHHPKERLAVSPQCGFGTSVLGNRIALEDQRAKLRRVVEVAEAVWG